MPVPERLAVGLVRGLHGLHGAVRVEVLTDEPERFSPGSVLYAEGEARPLTVAWTGPSEPGLLVRFAELATREAAEPLRDRYLEVPRPELPEGTWYWHEIRDLEVYTTTGESLGRVVDVFRAGEAEVYVVRGGTRGEVLVPAVRGVVVELAPPAGRLVVDPVALALPDAPPRMRRRHLRSREEKRAVRKHGRRRASSGRQDPEAPADHESPGAETPGAETPGDEPSADRLPTSTPAEPPT